MVVAASSPWAGVWEVCSTAWLGEMHQHLKLQGLNQYHHTSDDKKCLVCGWVWSYLTQTLCVVLCLWPVSEVSPGQAEQKSWLCPRCAWQLLPFTLSFSG